MMYRLIFLSGPLTGQRIAVDKAPMTLGRAPSCAVVLPDEESADEHAVIEHRLDGLYIRDLGSMHKILVNGHERREAKLKHGDELEIGRTRFLVQALLRAEVASSAGTRSNRRAVLLALLAAALASYAGYQRFVAPTRPAPAPAPIDLPGLTNTLPPPMAPPPDPPVPPAAPTPPPTNLLAAARVPGTETNPAVAAEIKRMRDQIRDIQSSISEIKAKPPAATAVVAAVVAPPTPAPAPAVTMPQIRIASLDQQKFQESDEADEVRVVTVGLIPAVFGIAPEKGSVRIEVQFYDEDTRTGIVAPSRAIGASASIPVDGPWNRHEPASITATYEVPKGARTAAERSGRPQRYYGYAVKVFYRDRLQDTDARPKTLLSEVPAAPSAGPNKAAASATEPSSKPRL